MIKLCSQSKRIAQFTSLTDHACGLEFGDVDFRGGRETRELREKP